MITLRHITAAQVRHEIERERGGKKHQPTEKRERKSTRKIFNDEIQPCNFYFPSLVRNYVI